MCCTRFAEYTGCKNSASAHYRTTLSGYIFATKASVDNRKKLGKQQYLLHKASHNMVNVGSQLRSAGECGARQQISTGFQSWFRYCTNVAQQSTKLCAMFGSFLGWYTIYMHFGGFCPLMEFCQAQK